MPKLTIDLKILDGETLEGTQLPDSCTTDKIIGQLVNALGLERFSNGKVVEYSLTSGGKTLSQDQTLRELGIQSGDVIEIVSSVPLSQTEHSPLPQSSAAAAGDTTEVFVKLTDMNKEVQVELNNRNTVEELIRQIVKRYGQRVTDEEGNVIKYYLKSRTSGRIFDSNKTLAEIGVPRLDRLALIRREVAGAKS